MPASDPFKVIVLGDSGVGKSTIVASHFGERFNPCYVQTRERVIKMAQVDVHGRRVNLQIWDTPGTDQCRTITTAYIRQDVKGVIVVFDVSNEETFLNVLHWMSTVRDYSGDDSLSVVIVGNKVDKGNRKVHPESGAKLAREHDAVSYIDASAKLNQNISQVFTSIAKAILSKQERPRSPPPYEDDDDKDETNTGFRCILV